MSLYKRQPVHIAMLFLGRILLMGETAMADKLTELVFILDKSGSMAGLERDTIGGYNAMLEKQRRLAAKCSITTVIFAHDYVLLHDRQDINAVSPLTETEYYVGGTTALLDAIGQTIHKVTRRQEETAVDSKAHKVLFVIITDGEENASREYSAAQIRQMIEHHQTKDGWEFVFLGANIDAVATATNLGIASNRAQNYHADAAGVELNFRALSDALTAFRENAAMPDDWNADIQIDYERRGDRR
jgi:uncharacterized protein YegL